MKTKALLAAMALAAGIWGPANAEPLDRQQVAADAKWLAHIDLDAVENSDVARKIRDAWLRDDAVKGHIRNLKWITGVDLARDVRSVTFYGQRLVKDTGVVMLHAKVDQKRLLKHLRNKADYQTDRYGDYTLHRWTEKKGAKGEHSVTGCFYAPALLVFGRDATEVKTALDVVNGKSPALADSDSPLGVDAPQGAIFVASLTGLAEAELPFKSPVVNKSKLLSITVGEHQGEVYGVVKFVAESEKVAEQLKAVVEGLRAMAILQHGKNEEAKGILQALSVSTSGQTVTAQWRGAAEDVWKLIEKELKKHQRAAD